MFERAVRRRPRIEIVPMIDVIFFLLVFFMLFSTFKVEPSGLDVDLPKAQTAGEQPASPLVITVAKTGQLYLGGQAIDGDALRKSVREALVEDPDLAVVIKGDKRAEWDSIVYAIDIVRAVGGSRLGLAVDIQR